MKKFTPAFRKRHDASRAYILKHKLPVSIAAVITLAGVLMLTLSLTGAFSTTSSSLKKTAAPVASTVASKPATVHANAKSGAATSIAGTTVAPAANSTAAGSTAGTTAGAATCTSAGRSMACTTPVKPESDLYNTLETKPSTIKLLDFQGVNTVEVSLKTGTASQYDVYLSGDSDMQNVRQLAIQNKVPFQSEQQTAASSGGGSEIFIWIILIALVLVLGGGAIYKRHKSLTAGAPGATTAGGGIFGGGAAGNTKKSAPVQSTSVTFADVIGQDDAKRKLSGIVQYLKDPERLRKIGAKVPKGVLLYGDPGEGKTLLARAVAGEAGVPFFHMNGSDFVEMYVGVGAKRIRELFASARAANSPAIIFIDEIDAIGKKRSGESGGGSDGERDNTLNALLVEMDGFALTQHPIIILAATNRAETLDKALLRPGRFTRKVKLTPPNAADLKKLYQFYTRSLAVAQDIDFDLLVKRSIGLSASAISEICNEASLLLFDSGEGDVITQDLFVQAIDDAIRQMVSDTKGKRFHNNGKSIKLADVIGQDLAKDDILDVINYLKDPAKFKARGADVPRGTLFEGGPGLGKTLLAKAVAGEADVPFFSCSGSDFVEIFVGNGAKRVRELFEEARRHAPAVVFIDEIDAVGKKRATSMVNSNDEREQTLNALLVEMDGFDSDSAPVIVLASTNRADLLDEALVRPGRFDRKTSFYKPDAADRLLLFQYYTRNKKLSTNCDLDHFAHNTAGYSGADIAKVCNEAAILLNRQDLNEITPELLDEASLRAEMGAARTNRVMSVEEKRNTAVHEGGHAVCHYVASGKQPIARITILPRANSGGHVQTMNDDKFFYTRDELRARIIMALGGRAAQEVVLGVTDTGASSDFKQARNIAYGYVVEYGMSDLGVLTEIDGVERSDEEKDAISREVRKLLDECDAEARSIINENRERFDFLVETLMDKETILGPDFARLWDEGPSALAVAPAAAIKAEADEPVPNCDGGCTVIDARELILNGGKRRRRLTAGGVRDGLRKALNTRKGTGRQSA